MRILLVEDDELLGDGLVAGLRQAGFEVSWVRDAEAAAGALGEGDPDVAVVDIGLPGRSGLELLRGLRRDGQDLPVLIITARDALSDRVRGLDEGADDYLVKPFAVAELAARLRAVWRRRQGGGTASRIERGDLVLDPAARTVHLAGVAVELSQREFVLLQDLLENQGRVLTKDRLEQALYGWNSDIGSNALEVHIHHLRRKLGPELIRTLRGVGYTIDRLAP